MVSHSLAEILSGLLETSSFGIIALDANGRVQAWSRGAERIFGWPKDEAVGGPASAALQLHLLPPGVAEVSLTRKDGTSVDVESFVAPWQDAAGNTQGTLAIVTDLSGRHATERELARVKQELVQVTEEGSALKSKPSGGSANCSKPPRTRLSK